MKSHISQSSYHEMTFFFQGNQFPNPPVAVLLRLCIRVKLDQKCSNVMSSLFCFLITSDKVIGAL